MAYYQNVSGPPPPSQAYQSFPPNLQQHQQQPQPQSQLAQQQQQQFYQGQRGYPQFQQRNQGSPPPNNLHTPQNPNFYQPPQQHQQQLPPQAHGYQQQQHNTPQPQPQPPQQHQQPNTPQQTNFQQSPNPNPSQYQPGYGGNEVPSMAPPSSTAPMNMSMNAGATMHPGLAQQRLQQQQQQQQQQQLQGQAHARNTSQQMNFQDLSQHNFHTPTPPTSATGKAFFQQPTPSPTKMSNPGMPPGSTPTSIPSSSPQQQGMGLPGQMSQKGPMGTPPQRPIINPLSEADTKKESERISVLLDINGVLIKAVMHLQQATKTGSLAKVGQQGDGQSSPTVSEGGNKGGEKEGVGEDVKRKLPGNAEYVECMRRMQANLAYLTSISDRQYKPPEKVQVRPAIMDMLPEIQGNSIPDSLLNELRNLYKSLKDLCPGAMAAPPMMGGMVQPRTATA